jgi:CHAD domain-containing protein
MAKTAMKTSRKATAKQKAASTPEFLSLGEYAHQILAKQYRRLVKQEEGVLQDSDPEYLHQMRVATRRLRTALQVIGIAVELPKPASAKRVQALTRVLGQLRDLDVQIAALRDEYQPQVPPAEQKLIKRAIERLHEQRSTAFAEVKSALTQAPYEDLKAAYESWLEKPKFTSLAQLPLEAVLPDLLSPLLSEFLLHPAWLIAAEDRSGDGGETLHELRKVCKHTRYQAEFFTDVYGKSFAAWVDELKQLQENLGTVQDTHVLLDILADGAANQADLATDMPKLHHAIQEQQAGAMKDWDTIRAKYIDAKFRRSLYEMILSPNLTPTK